jgi:hypothetical protein
MEQPAEPESASFEIANPERDKAALDLMQSRYEDLLAKQHGAGAPVDLTYFKEFISDNFKQIRDRHRCRKVVFTIESRNGRAEISARPKI